MASQKPREPTLTEQARRAQLIDVTTRVIAEHGYAGASLSRIAEAAGITKAAVLYHFRSKDAVVRAAYEHALADLVDHVGGAVEAAGVEEAPAAYVRSMVGYLRDHPHHTRVVVEALSHDGGERHSRERWGPLADLMGAARRARGLRTNLDLRTAALVVGGGIDAIIAEHLDHPDYDPATAAELLVTMLRRILFSEHDRGEEEVTDRTPRNSVADSPPIM